MGIEIERKYLVDHEKWKQLNKPEPAYLKQGYIINNDNQVVRVRIASKVGYLTIKGANKGIARKEYEYPIPLTDAAELLQSFAASVIEKNRYCISFAGKLWEVDEFSGDNAGLIVAEIELQFEEEKFEIPDWVASEVSGDARYYNSNLSTCPFSEWV